VADDEDPDDLTPNPPRRPPRKPGSDEKALTLEVARLFGMSPRQLIKRESVADEEDGPASTPTGNADSS